MSATESSSTLPDPSLPAPPLSADDEGFTAEQLIARQRELEEAAREAVPFSFTKGGCTYDRGYIRQPVYACRTCGGGGVCAGCSVGCHADHDLIELFAKRSFKCDCGTLSLCRGKDEKEKILSPCNLRSSDLKYAPQNDENSYGKNFDGQFCHCERGKTYDPEVEEETMFQCLCCEDWVHESCTSLRPSKAIDDVGSSTRLLADGPLVEHDSFEFFLCHDCVRKEENQLLQSYIGHKGWIICTPVRAGFFLPEAIDEIPAITVEARGEGWSHPWKVYGLQRDETVADVPGSVNGVKRMAQESEDEERSADNKVKRPKVENGLLVSDTFSDSSQDIKDGPDALVVTTTTEEEDCNSGSTPLFVKSGMDKVRLDVFLVKNFRDRVCLCSGCRPEVEPYPWLLEAEETYSPPRSQNSSQGPNDGQSEAGASQTSSTYDLGLAALQRLPRAQMMESLEAYSKMRDALFTHLRPFAESGRVVDGESLREFFRKQKEDGSASSQR